MYKHTQIGYASLATLGVSVLVVGVASTQPGDHAVLRWVLLLLVAMGVVFSRQTIEVRDGMLRCTLGPGVPVKAVPLSQIIRCEGVHTAWYYGWGIHRTPQGWLYNVSGSRAVAVTLTNGTQFCLGSDQPEALCHSILTSKAGAAPGVRWNARS